MKVLYSTIVLPSMELSPGKEQLKLLQLTHSAALSDFVKLHYCIVEVNMAADPDRINCLCV